MPLKPFYRPVESLKNRRIFAYFRIRWQNAPKSQQTRSPTLAFVDSCSLFCELSWFAFSQVTPVVATYHNVEPSTASWP